MTDYHGAPPSPGPEERARGWRGPKDAAFHPCLPEAEDLIWEDVCEVYVLKEDSEPKVPSPSFNDTLFDPRNPEAPVPVEETWDRRGIEQRRQELRARQSEFWGVMRDLRNDGYMGAGNASAFTFATRRRDHFEALLKVLTSKASL